MFFKSLSALIAPGENELRKWLVLVCLGLFAGPAGAAAKPDFVADADFDL